MKFEIVNSLEQAADQEKIWSDDSFQKISFQFWRSHLEWLGMLGWADAMMTVPREELNLPNFTKHRIVSGLLKFVEDTRLVNAHTGLTSSDVEDNVRRCQLGISTRILSMRLDLFINSLHKKWDKSGDQLGYTHWQPAFKIHGFRRVRSWTEPIRIINIWNKQSGIWGKKLGGAVGDNSTLLILLDHLGLQDSINSAVNQDGFPWDCFGLVSPRNKYPIQSADYVDEQFIINWISVVASQIYKIAADMRFLCSQGSISVKKIDSYVGSSSIPRKNNPIELEKICSMSRTLMGSQRNINDVIAHNGMERTLDTSWQLKNTLKDSTILLDKIINQFHSLDYVFNEPDQKTLDRFPEDEILKHQIEGKTRLEAFKLSNTTKPKS